MALTAQQWIDTGLVPTTGLAAWHMYQAGASGHNLIADYSGNGRNLTSAALNSAVLTAGVGPNNTPAWYFDGTTTIPLSYTGAVYPKHVFILASADESTFTQYRGLMGGVTSGDVFVSDSSGTKFFDVAHGSQTMWKSGTEYTEATAEAPVGGAFALVEARRTGGIALDGLQIGQQKADTTRRWKGYFSEMLTYTSDLSESEIARVYLYFNIKFKAFSLGLPLYFPCKHIVPNMQLSGGTMVNNRYAHQPADHAKITDSWEYEDGAEDFNEVADAGPRRWEYGYQNVSKHERLIFDAFWDAAKLSRSFYFHDNDGFTWSPVRIESYNPGHSGHMRWKQEISFTLKGQPTSTSVAEDIDAPVVVVDVTPPSVPGSLAFDAGLTGGELTWGASTD